MIYETKPISDLPLTKYSRAPWEGFFAEVQRRSALPKPEAVKYPMLAGQTPVFMARKVHAAGKRRGYKGRLHTRMLPGELWVWLEPLPKAPVERCYLIDGHREPHAFASERALGIKAERCWATPEWNGAQQREDLQLPSHCRLFKNHIGSCHFQPTDELAHMEWHCWATPEGVK